MDLKIKDMTYDAFSKELTLPVNFKNTPEKNAETTLKVAKQKASLPSMQKVGKRVLYCTSGLKTEPVTQYLQKKTIFFETTQISSLKKEISSLENELSQKKQEIIAHDRTRRSHMNKHKVRPTESWKNQDLKLKQEQKEISALFGSKKAQLTVLCLQQRAIEKAQKEG